MGISGLPELEKVVLTLEISPFDDSAKSKRVVSSPTGHYTAMTRLLSSPEGAFLQGILMIG